MRRNRAIIATIIILAVASMASSAPAFSAWFQTTSGDVHIEGGGMQTTIPATTFFSLSGSDYGDSGFVSYTSMLIPDTGQGSETPGDNSWEVQQNFPILQKYDYDYFNKMFPTANDLGGGTYYICNAGDVMALSGIIHKIRGSLSIGGISGCGAGSSPINVNNRQLIFLIEGNLDISREIHLTLNNGAFIAFIVKGEITIDGELDGSAGVPAIQGIYITDGRLSTGASNKQLYLSGVFVAWNGINLERTGGASELREQFYFIPELLLNTPYELYESSNIGWWREVAP